MASFRLTLNQAMDLKMTEDQGNNFFETIAAEKPTSGLDGDDNVNDECRKYNTVQCSTMQYNSVQFSTIQYSTIQYNIIQYNTTKYNTIQHAKLNK